MQCGHREFFYLLNLNLSYLHDHIDRSKFIEVDDFVQRGGGTTWVHCDHGYERLDMEFCEASAESAAGGIPGENQHRLHHQAW